MAFKPIRVKFKPSAKDVQVCEESGVDLAQAVHKAMKVQERQAGSSQMKTGGPHAIPVLLLLFHVLSVHLHHQPAQ